MCVEGNYWKLRVDLRDIEKLKNVVSYWLAARVAEYNIEHISAPWYYKSIVM